MKRKKKKSKKTKSGYSALCDHLMTAPCYWCGAKIMQGEKHKPNCRTIKAGDQP